MAECIEIDGATYKLAAGWTAEKVRRAHARQKQNYFGLRSFLEMRPDVAEKDRRGNLVRVGRDRTAQHFSR